MLVRLEESVVRAMAGSGALSISNLLMTSGAGCCAPPAEPPFPAMRSLPPFLKASATSSAERTILETFSGVRKRSFACMLSVNDLETISFFMISPGLKRIKGRMRQYYLLGTPESRVFKGNRYLGGLRLGECTIFGAGSILQIEPENP